MENPPSKRHGLHQVSAFLGTITQPIFKRRGFYQHKILTDWPIIVGEQFATYTIPQKMVTRDVKGNKEGVLYVDVTNSSVAMQLHYMEPIIIEKIATYFGYKAVTQLKIQQKPYHLEEKKKKAEILLSDDENQLLATMTGAITDGELQDSLHQLGKYILGKRHEM